jgi:hypothetical protein
VEVALGDGVDGCVAPLSLAVVHQPVVEQPQPLVGPQPQQLVRCRRLVQRRDGLEQGPDPAAQLARGVDVLRRHVRREARAVAVVKVDHGVGQRALVRGQVPAVDLQRGPDEGAVDLLRLAGGG